MHFTASAIGMYYVVDGIHASFVQHDCFFFFFFFLFRLPACLVRHRIIKYNTIPPTWFIISREKNLRSTKFIKYISRTLLSWIQIQLWMEYNNRRHPTNYCPTSNCPAFMCLVFFFDWPTMCHWPMLRFHILNANGVRESAREKVPFMRSYVILIHHEVDIHTSSNKFLCTQTGVTVRFSATDWRLETGVACSCSSYAVMHVQIHSVTIACAIFTLLCTSCEQCHLHLSAII